MYFPFASAPILYVIPCNVTGHSRGGVRKDGGVNKTEGVRIQARAQSPIPPLSGGEVARETEGKGRGLFERSEFRSPPTATVATSQKAR